MYLKSRILLSELAQSMDGKASFIISRLFKAYLINPQQLPDKTIVPIIKESDASAIKQNSADSTIASYVRILLKEKLNNNDSGIHSILLRKICDYIAGMTDQYALEQYKKLYEV